MILKCDRIEDVKIPEEKEYKTSTIVCEAVVLLMLLITFATVMYIIA